MHHVLEHLDNPIDVLRECHRILKDNGLISIVVPYGFNYSLAHKNFFNEYSLDTIIYPVADLREDGCQDDFCFVEIEPVKLIRTISFKIPFLRRLGIYSCGVNESSFEKRLGLSVNKCRTFGNRKDIVWKLKKFR